MVRLRLDLDGERRVAAAVAEVRRRVHPHPVQQDGRGPVLLRPDRLAALLNQPELLLKVVDVADLGHDGHSLAVHRARPPVELEGLGRSRLEPAVDEVRGEDQAGPSLARLAVDGRDVVRIRLQEPLRVTRRPGYARRADGAARRGRAGLACRNLCMQAQHGRISSSAGGLWSGKGYLCRGTSMHIKNSNTARKNEITILGFIEEKGVGVHHLTQLP